MQLFRSDLLAGLAVIGLLAAAGATPSRAQDVVRYSQAGAGAAWQDLSGVIEKEGPAGIQIKSRDRVVVIPAENIVLVQYKHPTLLAVDFRAAQDRISQALVASGPQMAEKVKQARDAADKLAEKAGNEAAVARYAAWQVALSRFAEAKANGKQPEAVSILERAVVATRGGWEEVQALRMLVEQQQLMGQPTTATLEKWSRMAGLPVESQSKIQNRLRLAKISEGKAAEVATELASPDGADLAKAALLELALLVAGPFDAMKLRQTRLALARLATKETEGAGQSDEAFLAGCQVVLGNYLMTQKKPEEAVWEWIRVEAQYPGNKAELAEALFHLGSLYESQLKNPSRASECLDRLQGREFAGSVRAKK